MKLWTLGYIVLRILDPTDRFEYIADYNGMKKKFGIFQGNRENIQYCFIVRRVRVRVNSHWIL